MTLRTLLLICPALVLNTLMATANPRLTQGQAAQIATNFCQRIGHPVSARNSITP